MSGKFDAQGVVDLDVVNAELTEAKADASSVIQWAADAFGDGLVMTSSFGAQSAVMLHLATQVKSDIPIILIDTGYLFNETYLFVKEMTERLDLNLKVYVPQITSARMEALHGKLWDKDLEGIREYHKYTKIEPLQRALKELGATAWLAGLRGQQTDYRSTLRFVEKQGEQFKIHPILTWSTKEVHEYLKKHDLPYHPLYEQGYVSIGDTHSTLPVTAGMSEREGRFKGLKQECGIHLPSSASEAESRDASGL